MLIYWGKPGAGYFGQETCPTPFPPTHERAKQVSRPHATYATQRRYVLKQLILEADLHVHTIASGHAYSTLTEICQAAALNGLRMVATTDHGPAMPGGPHYYYFGNFRIIPPEIDGVRVLTGVEANILNHKGDIDLFPGYARRLDIVWAGLHTPCIRLGNREENTQAMLGALDNPLVDGIVHPGNPDFLIDAAAVARRAAETNKLIEINNASLFIRPGSRENCILIAQEVASQGGMVVVNSDAHYASDVGNFAAAIEMLDSVGFPQENILNTSVAAVWEFVSRRRKERQKKL